jgi:hypothetical protein
VNPEDLLTIDVSAEVSTLCGAQLQGPWQVPAELVRLATARGAARVDLRRTGRGIRLECDGALTTRAELADLARILDGDRPPRERQDAISSLEEAGGSALLWAAGLPGTRLELVVRSGGVADRIVVRRGLASLESVTAPAGSPVTAITWRCSGLKIRRAVAWLRTALRFLPVPAAVDGRAVDRGFPGGLYRMRIDDPLPTELVIEVSGETPSLWLLEHGVLSTRAMVPGYPAFSAAVEMSDVVPAGTASADLRRAVTPYLPRLIDQATRMLVLLADRLPDADEAIRRRLTILLLRSAILDLSRDRVMAVPLIPVRRGAERRFESLLWLARSARDGTGVLTAVEPGSDHRPGPSTPVIEAATEERGLLAEVLGLRVERWAGGSRPRDLGPRLLAAPRRAAGWLRGLVGPPPRAGHELSRDERFLIDAAAGNGFEIGLCDGSGPPRRRRSVLLLSRDRPEVRRAVRVVAGSGDWLYPALVAAAGEVVEIPDRLRDRWLESMEDG